MTTTTHPPIFERRETIPGYAFFSSAVLQGATTANVGSLHGANMQRHVTLTFVDPRMNCGMVFTLAEAQALASELLEAVRAMQAATRTDLEG